MPELDLGSVIGPQGPQGKTGATGAQGPAGATGATGPAGEKGATGTRGSLWYNGTGITGTSTTAAIFSGSGVSSALVNDYYINTGTGADRGRVYRCTTAGAASAAKWVYAGTLIGPQGAQGIQGPVGPAGPNSAGLIGVVDTSGAVGTAGANTNTQVLIDALADKVMTKLLEKTAIVQTESTATDKVPSSAYLKQALGIINSNFDGLFGDGVKKTMSLINSGNTLRSTIYNDSAGTYITSRNFATGIATRLALTDNHLSIDKFTFTVRPDGTFADVSTGSSTIV